MNAEDTSCQDQLITKAKELEKLGDASIILEGLNFNSNFFYRWRADEVGSSKKKITAAGEYGLKYVESTQARRGPNYSGVPHDDSFPH